MTVREAISTRRSVRAFLPSPVEDEKLKAVLDAGRLAPSAQNAQNWKFVLAKSPGVRAALADAAENQASIVCAPAIIAGVATSSRFMKCGQPTNAVNLSIAASFMLLQAHELGLGMCWLGRFDAKLAAAAVNAPAGYEVVFLAPIGYPAETPPEKPRFSFEETILFDSF